MNKETELLEISELDAAELEGLASLLMDVVEDGASIGFMPPLSREEAEQYWKGVPEPGVHLWVVRHEGRVAGTVQLQLAMKANGSHRAEIAKLMVHPSARRAGLARLLMRTAEETATRLGRTLLVLDTRAGDPSNLLYRSLGFVEAGRIPKYARSAGGQLHTTVIFYKDLEEPAL